MGTGADQGAAAWAGFLAGLELSQAGINKKISAKKGGGMFFKALIFNILNQFYVSRNNATFNDTMTSRRSAVA